MAQRTDPLSSGPPSPGCVNRLRWHTAPYTDDSHRVKDEEAILAFQDDRRTGCTAVFALVGIIATLLAFASPRQAFAQCDCLGDIAGRPGPNGSQLPDGIINELDLIQLIAIVEGLPFNACADMDGSGTITLGPTTVGDPPVWFPGDFDLLLAAFGVCNPVCQAASSGPFRPCERLSLGAGCSEELCCALICEAEPICCDVEWDKFCAVTARELCTTNTGNCLLTSEDPGCLDEDCENAVCLYDPQGNKSFPYAYCCELFWDRSCVEVAGEQCRDAFCAPFPKNCPYTDCGDPFSGKCTLEHFGPGCSDAACCTLVCLVDPFCCESTWDAFCALQATEACPSEFGTCGRNSANSCYVVSPLTAGCNDFNCCNEVCQIDPYCCVAQWDSACALRAFELCSTFPTCGDIGSCRIPHKTPGCDDPGCCDQVCSLDPTCCEISWDKNCVTLANFQCNGCGDLDSGSCFASDSNNSPSCNDRECCETVCTIDPFCCTDEWDNLCVDLADGNCFDPLLYCGSELARSCFIAGATQGCDSVTCCEEICKFFDPYCCEVQWDAICVTTAFSLDQCQPALSTDGRGNCLEERSLPGCGVPSCMAAVCDVDPFCCTTSWNSICVSHAEVLCFDKSTCNSTAPCQVTHPDPGCEDPYCCNIVCSFDPACCDISWDNLCAVFAIENCNGSNLPTCPCAGGCFETHDNPGCDIESCCTAVCKFDGDGDGKPDFPECCEVEWDLSCVQLAKTLCCSGTQCGDICAGSCLESTGTPNCDDPACCSAVCAIDPYCCNIVWDGQCANEAEVRCRRGCGVESSGSCFVGKLTPGCEDAECCATICQDIDPFCCEASWDLTCTELALKSCDPPECGAYQNGDCCLVHESPACDDERCCDAVCLQDPFCCDAGWDDLCVFLARQSPECPSCSFDCGDLCAGDCCEANGTPGCNDTECCTIVCLLDVYCCSNEWDLYCAQAALTNCNGQNDACPAPECGDPLAGGCCFQNGSPSCNDEACCESVCLEDPFCCSVGWDEVCADIARLNKTACDCGGGTFCGDPTAGDCCEPNTTPHCSDAACCESICLIEPFCCSSGGSWDTSCAGLAEALCNCTPAP